MIGEWWQWCILGIVLIIAELYVPMFLLIWFGLGALVVALIQHLNFTQEIYIQLGMWTTFSVVMTLLWFRLFKVRLMKSPVGTSSGGVIGEVGMITESVAPFHKGKIRFQKPIMGSDVWVCVSDTTLSAGERAKLVAIEGNFLIVEAE